jgi:ankyrin repeat protein
MRRFLLLAAVARLLSAQSVGEIRGAVTRALPVLQRSASSFVAQRGCVSCHHNILPILTLHSALDHGMEIDRKVLDAVEEKTFREIRKPEALDEAIQAANLNDPTPDESYLLMAAHSAGIQPDLTLAVYAARLASWQRDGHWVTSDFRPPHSSSPFTATATAIRAIQLYMPEERKDARDACFQRARRWLTATHPTSTEDASFRLLGLVWAAASANDIDAARHDLLAFQKAAGGWPELPLYQPDAYSTGQALYALHEAGFSATSAEWRRGLKFLISTQAPDGTWHVRTRMLSPASVSPKYFTTGFPYRKDEYLSYAGSCWAVMALLEALPGRESAPQFTGRGLFDPSIPAALFGTAQQLTSSLAAGLDPNYKTPHGTTLLMMAAPDAEKVKLLLAHGADPKIRTGSGFSALGIATAYRGTAASILALLNAGAPIDDPPGVRFRNLPLVFASMTGDLENVTLLLQHGADPSAGSQGRTPLAQAVTFGYPDIVQALISAGAPADMKESSGINLLHWAAIANRPEVIPALFMAGVPVNAQDENGYTPLMYAATIDFGDTELVKTLLRAGADPGIRNGDGRNACEQAKYYRHTQIEDALR